MKEELKELHKERKKLELKLKSVLLKIWRLNNQEKYRKWNKLRMRKRRLKEKWPKNHLSIRVVSWTDEKEAKPQEKPRRCVL